MTQLVQCLPRTHKALSLISWLPSTMETRHGGRANALGLEEMQENQTVPYLYTN